MNVLVGHNSAQTVYTGMHITLYTVCVHVDVFVLCEYVGGNRYCIYVSVYTGVSVYE